MCSLKFIKIQIKTVLIKTLAVTKIVFLSMAPKEPANIHDNELSSFSSLVFIGTNTSQHICTNKKVQYYVQKVELLNMKRIWVIPTAR